MIIQNEHSDETIAKELGKRIARARLNRNWTQAMLAHESGVSKPTLQRIESGGTSNLLHYLRLFRCLNVLERLETILPESSISPMQLLKNKGQEKKRARQSTKPIRGKEDTPWQWGTP